MKRNILYLHLSFITLFTTMISGCDQSHVKPREVTINENIIHSKGFYVNSESTELNTSVRGTIFISGKEESIENVKIVSTIKIDPKDWGGVVFYVPNNLNISNIITSYPETKNGIKTKDFVTIWNNSDNEYGMNKMVEVGTNRYTPTGGGNGTVVINLSVKDKNQIKMEKFKILVGVGSEGEDGNRSIHPDTKLVKVTIP